MSGGSWPAPHERSCQAASCTTATSACPPARAVASGQLCRGERGPASHATAWGRKEQGGVQWKVWATARSAVGCGPGQGMARVREGLAGWPER